MTCVYSDILMIQCSGTQTSSTTSEPVKCNIGFVGAFEKLRRATISFAMSVRPSVHMEQIGSHWTDFHEIWYLNIFRKTVEKIQILLKSDTNNGFCT
jgi:hypothetical protein